MPSISSILLYKSRGDDTLPIIGKIQALQASKRINPEPVFNTPMEMVSAPYLKGDGLLRYLAANHGIKGMLNRGLPVETLQGVLARCKKEEGKKDNGLTASCISSYVEIFKSEVAVNRPGYPDFIVDMGYGHHFPCKWHYSTYQNVYMDALFHIMPTPIDSYLPTLRGWDSLIGTSRLDYTQYKRPIPEKKTVIKDSDGQCVTYWVCMSNLLTCLKAGRFQEGIAYGFELYTILPNVLLRPLDLALYMAQCCGALHCYDATRVMLELACYDAKRLYEKARIVSAVQNIFQHWGCFEEETLLFHGSGLDDKFSVFYAEALRHHMNAQLEYAVNTLAVRACRLKYHRFCLEACPETNDMTCAIATRDILAELNTCIPLVTKYLPNGNAEFYLSTIQMIEAADMTLQLHTPKHNLVQTLLGSSLYLSNLALGALEPSDPNRHSLKALKPLAAYTMELKTKKYYLSKMARNNISMARQTGIRQSLLAGSVAFTQGILLAILGPQGSSTAPLQLVRQSKECFEKNTMHRSYKTKLTETCIKTLFGSKHHGIAGQKVPEAFTLALAKGDANNKELAKEFLYGNNNLDNATWRDNYGDEGWAEKLCKDDFHLTCSINFGLKAISKQM